MQNKSFLFPAVLSIQQVKYRNRKTKQREGYKKNETTYWPKHARTTKKIKIFQIDTGVFICKLFCECGNNLQNHEINFIKVYNIIMC